MFHLYDSNIVFLFVEFCCRNMNTRHTHIAHVFADNSLRDGKLIIAPNELQTKPNALLSLSSTTKGHLKIASYVLYANSSWSHCMSHFHISFLTAGTTLSPINVCFLWRASNLFFDSRRFMVAHHIIYYKLHARNRIRVTSASACYTGTSQLTQFTQQRRF